MNGPGRARTPLEAGVFLTLSTLGFGTVVGLIAVLDADSDGSAIAIGVGVALVVFLGGATMAPALACLARRRLELLSLVAILAAGLAIDLFAVGIWRDVDSETYGKVVGILFAWAFFALLVLGLTLAVRTMNAYARPLYLATLAVSLLAALLTTWLIASSGTENYFPSAGPVPAESLGEEELLRPLGVAFVLLATLWFATLAAGRLEARPRTNSF
jgi:hypothetical protein